MTLKVILKMILKVIFKVSLKMSLQDKELDDLLNEQILSNPQISTGDMAELSNRNSKNIKCQLAKCHMLVMSVVIRGHWEVLGKE
jgi:hypothetical protein